MKRSSILIGSKRRHAVLLLAWLTSVALLWVPLCAMVHLSLNDSRYSHLIVIPFLSAGLFYWKRKRIFLEVDWCPRFGLALLALGAAVAAAGRLPWLGESERLSVAVFGVVVIWTAGFVLCYGAHAFKGAQFPILFLLLMAPIPQPAMERTIFFLQTGSADISYAFFRLAGIPTFRHGFTFELPVTSIEVAQECSSIHSAWALFISGVLVGHVTLKSFWSKCCLSALTLPIAVFTNAIRIFTLWWLSANVDIGFMFGNLHHRGGALFSLISISILLALVAILRKSEHTVSPQHAAG